MGTGNFILKKNKFFSGFKVPVPIVASITTHGACTVLKKRHFGERLCEIIFDMGQWFRISCCLKMYFVLVLVAGYFVQHFL